MRSLSERGGDLQDSTDLLWQINKYVYKYMLNICIANKSDYHPNYLQIRPTSSPQTADTEHEPVL